MPYTTLTQLTARYGERLLLQVADRGDPPAGVVDTAIVDQALADTDAVIDGYLAGRYQLPLGSVPPQLPPIAQSIAVYKLHAYSPEDKIEKEYQAAIADLVRIANGVIRLAVAGIEPTSSGASGVETIDRDRDFTPENMRGFI